MIRVYDATERLFANNGIKVLNPLFAEITKIDNSDYYVELEDMLDNMEYYQKGMIIRVPTPWGVQGFRCDNPIIQNDRISCKAWHLSYDSENYLIRNAEAVGKNCNDALNQFNDATDETSPFTVSSDIEAIPLAEEEGKPFTVSANKVSLFNMFELLVSAYGGHWYRDNFTFAIRSSVGEDRGVVLAYNKNITDIKVEENWDDVCTKILPYVVVRDQEYYLDTTYVTLEEELYDIPFKKAVKFESKMDLGNYISDVEKEKISDWLYNEAKRYLEEHKSPKVNYSVSAKLDNVSDVGDTIHIKHPKIISNDSYIKTNVISVKYDVIRGRYTNIEFGNFKREIKNLAQEVATVVQAENDKKLKETSTLLQNQVEETSTSLQNEIGETSTSFQNQLKETSTLLQNQLASSTATINSVLSGSNVINNGNEIIVVDRLPKEEAVYCLKINSAGIGFSNSGIYGTFTSAWTLDGTLNMQAINVINFTASLIKGGVLKLGGTNNSSGTFELYNNSNKLVALMDRTGLTVYASNGDYVKLNADDGFAGYNRSGAKIYWADGDVFRMKNAEVENEIKIAGKIKIVPVSTDSNVGVGFVALV